MNVRPALRDLAVEYSLSAESTEKLLALADRPAASRDLQATTAVGLAILASALCGFGLICWIAANWDMLGHSGKFALLEALVVVLCAGTLRSRIRVPMGLMTLLAIGALFSYFGQTYQTGADPWQLFALWAALALPLCLAIRHDALWAPWTLLAMTAVTLWLHASIGYHWDNQAQDLPVHIASWLMSIILVCAMSPQSTRITGAGIWTMRTALSLTVARLTFAGVGAAVVKPAQNLVYILVLAIMAGAAWAYSTPRLRDTFALSVVGLSLNMLLLAALVRVLVLDENSSRTVDLLVTGIVAAALLAVTVRFVLRQSRLCSASGAVQ